MVGMSGRPRFARQLEARFWVQIRDGSGIEKAAAAVGVSVTTGQRWFPALRRPRLTLEQREEIAVLKAEGLRNAEIARRVGVHRSTIGRSGDQYDVGSVAAEPGGERHPRVAGRLHHDRDLAGSLPAGSRRSPSEGSLRDLLSSLNLTAGG